MYLNMMVFTWAPLSKRAMQLSPFIFTLATFSILYHCWKGSGFKKGVCEVVFTPWEPPSEGSSWCSWLSEGSGLPLLLPSPPSHLTASCLSGLHKLAITGEMFRAATVVTAFLICLGVFHCPCQSDHELLCHPLNSTRIITLWILTVVSILFF